MAKQKKSLKIEWTATAEKQFFLLLDYWIERNQSDAYAKKLSRLVWERLEFIAQHPLATLLTSYPDTRKVAMGHFSIFFKIIDDTIFITAFWDNRQDPKTLHRLLQREEND